MHGLGLPVTQAPGCRPGGVWQLRQPGSLSKVTCGRHYSGLAWEPPETWAALSPPEPVSDSWQKGKAQGAPSGTLGSALPAGGQVQGGGAGPAAWPEPWESPGSPQGTPGKWASWPERLCWALVSELLSRAGLKIAGGRQGQHGEGLGGCGWQPGPCTAVNGTGTPTPFPVAGQPRPS